MLVIILSVIYVRNTIPQNLWFSAKVVLKGKSMAYMPLLEKKKD